MYFDNYEITIFGTGQVDEVIIGQRYVKELYGKKYYFIPISTNNKSPLSLYYAINEIKWIKNVEKFDCIYAQRIEYTLPFMFSKNKRKVIQMIHGSSKYSEIGFGKKIAKVYPIFERMAIKIAGKTLIILNREEFGVPYYKQKYNKYKHKIFYGKNPINTEIYCKKSKVDCRRKLGFHDNDNIIVFSGRVENNPKRVMLYPDICRGLIKKGYKFTFVVVGDGNDKKLLEKKIIDYGLSDYFELTGYIDDSNMIANYVNCADVTINISMFEGTSTSVLESISCGVPVISTDVGDIHECISDNENGIIISNDNDTQVINDSIEAIIEILTKSIKMNQNHLKYNGYEVANELKFMINNL